MLLKALIKVIDRLRDTQNGRRYLVKKYGFLAFCIIYLRHHFSEPMGLVHFVVANNISNIKKPFVAISSFRDSGKTTICTLAYPTFAICEKLTKFTVLISDTEVQTELLIESIKSEFERNELLIEDYGDLKGEYWGKTGLLTRDDIKVLGRSTGQKVRGLKYRQSRPDLIIVDDPETTEDIRTKDRRDKTYKWFFHEVYPARAKKNGRIFYIGNLIHSDCLLARLQKKPNWVSQHIALTDTGTEEGTSFWRARYPDKATIMKEKEGHDPILWQREYMLKLVPEEGQIIKEVTHYTNIPKEAVYYYSAVGIDPAISKKETADYTAFVRGDVFTFEGRFLVYITRTHHARLGMNETIEYAKSIGLNHDGSYAHFFVEDVAYQKALIEQMEQQFLPVTGITTGTQDKRARLHGVAPMIQKGQVLFPESGADDLIMETIGFGIEPHDDLMDALVHLLRGIQKLGLRKMEVQWL